MWCAYDNFLSQGTGGHGGLSNTPHVRRHHYQVDDRVWLHHPPTAQHKLRLPWTGPFVITATLPADSPTPILYRIRPETGNQRLQVVHHNRLKPYIAPTRRRLPAPPDAPRPGYAGFIQHQHLFQYLPSQQPYRTPVHRRDALREQLSSMLEQDVIEPSTSPWASPVVIVTKKDGTPRFCVDFRKLNSVTVPDAHPLPRIDDTIDALAGSYYFSTLDMKSAYWQVPVHPADRHKTAFCTAEGLWQFKVLPFGLSNSAATYQRLVQLILAGVGWDVCLAYLDDIIVFTPTFDEHLHTLQEVFTRLRQAGLKLHPAKCRFAQKEVTFLGHVVSRRGVAPDPDNIAKVQDWPTPSNQTDIRSFLGLASFYRKFVPAFATVAEPLVRLTDKHHTFQWNPACQSAFDTLKHQLTNPPLLAFPDFASDFTLATDASTSGIGAVLTQTHGGTQRVVAYASKTLSRTQRRWSTYDREFWAAVWAIRHFRPYLYGRNFTLLTDHRPLLSCREVPLGDGMAQGRRTRWAIELSTYQFTIKYRPGPTNTDADALSRRPPSPPPDNVDAALDTPNSAEVVVRDTAEPAEVISADDSTEPQLLHDVVRDARDSANVVSADDQPAPVPASSPEVVRDDHDSANVVSADDQPAPVPAPSPEVVRDDRDSANVVSADDQPAPVPAPSPEVVRDDRDSANVVSADDQPAPVPAPSPEVVRDDRDSANVISADDPSAPVPASPPDVVRDNRVCHSHQHPRQEAICSAAHLATAPAIDFRAAQQADATIRKVRQWLQDPAGRPPALAVRGKHRDLTSFWSDFDSLFLSDDLLYRRPVNSPPSVQPQLVIPRELACHVLPALHDDSTAGHFGPSRTLHRARERFYWLGMTMDVARHCRECVPCQQRRQPVPSLRAPFQHITADRPFQVVATDITYMPLSSAGNKYVLVVSDVFTKYVNLYPIPKQDAATVADKLFRDFVGQHGVPDQIHSDQGSQFESQLVAELCARLQISKTRTSPYHPQGDGQVERFNRTMKNILAKALAGREHDWDLLLPHVALAYNTSVHSTTKFTPYFLVHGREARLPVDIACQLPATTAQLADLNAALTSVRQAIAQSHRCHQCRGDHGQETGMDPRLASKWGGCLAIEHSENPSVVANSDPEVAVNSQIKVGTDQHIIPFSHYGHNPPYVLFVRTSRRTCFLSVRFLGGYMYVCYVYSENVGKEWRLRTSLASGFRTEVVLTMHGCPAFAHVFARRQHAEARTAGCDQALTSHNPESFRPVTLVFLSRLTQPRDKLHWVSLLRKTRVTGRKLWCPTSRSDRKSPHVRRTWSVMPPALARLPDPLAHVELSVRRTGD
ncbi:hypothetical protein Bbelb_031010 [Branchiostoma belcheri]|nr:hypothetical protein Bbelb_031010 [Branchiostoma belcheri]